MTTMNDTPNTGKPKIYRGGSASVALAHLLDNGPTPEAALREVMRVGSAGTVLRNLEELGYVKAKLWLTPEGLEAARELGLVPQLAGVVKLARCCGCQGECGCPL